MPIFDYECTGCGFIEERIVKMSMTLEDEKLMTCNVCDSLVVRTKDIPLPAQGKVYGAGAYKPSQKY